MMLAATERVLDPERSYEIVNGVPEEKEMPGGRHGRICSRLDRILGTFVEQHELGETYVETNFQIGNNERIPDLAFVAKSRIPLAGEPEGKWLIPPDLAIEIISPTDFYDKVHTKVLEYLAAGVQEVWLVSPEHHHVTIYRSTTNIMTIPEEGELTSPALLPGFCCALREIFKTATAASTSPS